MSLNRLILPFILILQAAFTWRGLYIAQTLPYDDNFGMLIGCFLLSLLTLIILIAIWFINRQWIKENIMAILMWFLIASPITIFVAMINYEEIFKAKLAV